MAKSKITLFAKVMALSLGVVLSTTACGEKKSTENSKETIASSEAISSETNSSEVASSKSSEAPASSKSSKNASSSTPNSSRPSSSSAGTSKSSTPAPIPETGTTLTVDLGVAHTFNNNVATLNGVGTVGSDYTPAFKLTKVSSAADALTIKNNKTVFKQGDTLENVDKLGGVNSITVHGGNGNFKLYVGYTKENMYEFLEATSNSGDRIFENVPNINYFKLVGKYDNYPAEIADITFTYTRNASHELVYGQSKPISECTIFEGDFVKNGKTLTVAGNKITLGDKEYTYTGIFYNGQMLYETADNEGILVKFDNENTAIVIDCVDKYSSLSGTYTKVIPATAIKMFVNGTEVAANSTTSRYEMQLGAEFNFSATCNAVPSEDVAISLVDETNAGGVDTWVGTYTPRGTISVSDIYYTWNAGDQFELTVNPIVVTKDATGYKATYSDVATSGYAGTSGTFSASVSNNKLVFTSGYLTIRIGSDSNHTIEFDYEDEDNEYVYAMGSITSNFVSSAQPTASFANGKVKATNAGDFYLSCSTSNGVAAKYYVHVKAYVPATVSVDPATVSLEKGATYQINATVNADATNKALTYSSDKTSIATVSNTGLVTAKAKGKAEITITTADGNTAKLTVNVTETVVAKTYTFMDEETFDDHTLVVMEGVSATIDNTYVFNYKNGHYRYSADEDIYFDIRNAGGTSYLDYVDDSLTFFGYADCPVVTFSGGSIEITEI